MNVQPIGVSQCPITFHLMAFQTSSTLSPSLFTHSAAELKSRSLFFSAFILERPGNINV